MFILNFKLSLAFDMKMCARVLNIEMKFELFESFLKAEKQIKL